jgi:phosphoheptose isomerase
VESGRLLTEDSATIAHTGHDMAVRFHGGGKLLVFSNGGASTDAAHQEAQTTLYHLLWELTQTALSATKTS